MVFEDYERDVGEELSAFDLQDLEYNYMKRKAGGTKNNQNNQSLLDNLLTLACYTVEVRVFY